VKLVHLVDFITKKFVTMHGHMNVKLYCSIRASLAEPLCTANTGMNRQRISQHIRVFSTRSALRSSNIHVATPADPL